MVGGTAALSTYVHSLGAKGPWIDGGGGNKKSITINNIWKKGLRKRLMHWEARGGTADDVEGVVKGRKLKTKNWRPMVVRDRDVEAIKDPKSGTAGVPVTLE